jgi:hypothetical protein
MKTTGIDKNSKSFRKIMTIIFAGSIFDSYQLFLVFFYTEIGIPLFQKRKFTNRKRLKE